MDKKDAALEIDEFLRSYLRSREHFLEEALDETSFWDERDEAALHFAGATPHKTDDVIALLFYCSKQLTKDSPLVKEWVDECLAAALEELPEAHEGFTIDVTVGQSHRWMEAL